MATRPYPRATDSARCLPCTSSWIMAASPWKAWWPTRWTRICAIFALTACRTSFPRRTTCGWKIGSGRFGPFFGPFMQRQQRGEQARARRRKPVVSAFILLDDAGAPEIAQALAEHAGRHPPAARLQSAKTQTLLAQLRSEEHTSELQSL